MVLGVGYVVCCRFMHLEIMTAVLGDCLLSVTNSCMMLKVFQMSDYEMLVCFLLFIAVGCCFFKASVRDGF